MARLQKITVVNNPSTAANQITGSNGGPAMAIDVKRGIRRLLIAVSVAYWAVVLVSAYSAYGDAAPAVPPKDWKQYENPFDKWDPQSRRLITYGGQQITFPAGTKDDAISEAFAKQRAEAGREASTIILRDSSIFYLIVAAIVGTIGWVARGFRRAAP